MEMSAVLYQDSSFLDEHHHLSVDSVVVEIDTMLK